MEIDHNILYKHASSLDNNHLLSQEVSMMRRDFWELEWKMLILFDISKLLSSNKVLAAQNCYSEAGTLVMNERHALALAGWSPSSPTTRTTCSPPALERLWKAELRQIMQIQSNNWQTSTIWSRYQRENQEHPLLQIYFPDEFFILLYFCNFASCVRRYGHLSSLSSSCSKLPPVQMVGIWGIRREEKYCAWKSFWDSAHRCSLAPV